MSLLRFLSISAISSLLIGEIIRITPFFGGVFTVTDILTILTAGLGLFYFMAVSKSLKFPEKIAPFFVFFIISALASTILAFNKLSVSEVLISSLFLVRYVAYFAFFVVLYNLYKKNHVKKFLNLFFVIGILFALVGLTQFVLLPDLRFLAKYGWDPHYFRLVASFLDPNFTGIFLVLLIIPALSFYIFQKKFIYLLLTLFFFIALILTFSRSSYLALLAALLVLGILKSPKIALGAVLLFLILSLFIPKVRSRIEGAFALDETASARIISWKKALEIIKKNYLFGVGFNTYRYTQKSQGFFNADNPEGEHSGSGTDSSLLFVLATTGAVGTLFYVLAYTSALRLSVIKAASSPINLAIFSSLVALLIHSQFVNSLFFPPVMLVFWFFLSLLEINAS